MSPFGPLDVKEEQSEEERLAIARRYRGQRRRELRELAAPCVEDEIEEAGEFSTVPIESLAAIPILGAFFALAVRARQSRKRMTPDVLVAVTREEVHVLGLHSEVEGTRAEPVSHWPRNSVRVSGVTRKFMRDEVVLEIDGEDSLKLYANTLRTNPWSAGVVRALGGKAPDPIDLGAAEEDG
ncbi:MAG TPA: hypothetical protein VKA36_06240 [Solirubrobacterales bacterium]|nr:hypothetical protein [Solirubrobacterales bacterium]